nr:MAG TPA: hypothetical protein [Caudoviricetes sp.]
MLKNAHIAHIRVHAFIPFKVFNKHTYKRVYTYTHVKKRAYSTYTRACVYSV